jgi:nitroreductase/NAD-dependent dihydropyrimidine dehydrogenase PreA subunit
MWILPASVTIFLLSLHYLLISNSLFIMSFLITDSSKCRRCAICKAVCPMSIIETNDEGFPFVSEENESFCVQCGHCEAACPSLALKHLRLPEMRVIMRDKVLEINSENLSEYFCSRRSIRTFLPQTVDRCVLEKIFDAVRYAPTGINRQQNRWVVLSGAESVGRLSRAVIDWMKSMVVSQADLATYLNFSGLIGRYEEGEDVICRGAGNLIIGYTDALYTGGAIDTVIATAHLELLLPSYGLGGCWAGFVMIALGYSQEVRDCVGLNELHTVHSALMAGYPKYSYSKIPHRNAAEVQWM